MFVLAWWVTFAKVCDFVLGCGISLAEIRHHSQEIDTRDVATRLGRADQVHEHAIFVGPGQDIVYG
jgi:hypothetical protein